MVIFGSPFSTLESHEATHFSPRQALPWAQKDTHVAKASQYLERFWGILATSNRGSRHSERSIHEAEGTSKSHLEKKESNEANRKIKSSMESIDGGYFWKVKDHLDALSIPQCVTECHGSINGLQECLQKPIRLGCWLGEYFSRSLRVVPESRCTGKVLDCSTRSSWVH